MNRVKCQVFSRVVGYYRPVENWNEGKQSEFKDRKTFKNIHYQTKIDSHKNTFLPKSGGDSKSKEDKT